MQKSVYSSLGQLPLNRFFFSRTGSRDGWTVPELIVNGETRVSLGKRKRIVGEKKNCRGACAEKTDFTARVK